MESEILQKLEQQQNAINAMLVSMEKTRKYLLVTMWIGVATVVGPIIGLLFIVPWFINAYGSALEGLI